MELREVQFGGQPPIDGYGPGFFRVGGEAIEGAILITPIKAVPWTGLSDVDALLELKDQIDVLFIGMGADIANLPAGIREMLTKAGIHFELMSSPAAARTYNVLLSEERRVAVALLPV